MKAERAEILLATLMQYARRPMSANSPGWTVITVPSDFVDELEKCLAEILSNQIEIQELIVRMATSPNALYEELRWKPK